MVVLQNILDEDNMPEKDERFEHLYKCMLDVMLRVVRALGCHPLCLRQDQVNNKLLSNLFKETHSDESYKIFKSITYNRLKWEGHYKEVCLEASVDPVGFKEGNNKWVVGSDSEDEESMSPTTPSIKPDETERL